MLVQGPPGCGKTTVIRSLVKHYTRHSMSEVKGPVTVVSGKKRRIQFMEVSNDLNDMVDAAKLADLVLLLVDGSYGFEMETFEFLNVLQVHGFPKVMGVLTHLDQFHDAKKLKKQKKTLKARFWSEIYNGAKLFYLSGMQHGRYNKRDTLNLARFISTSKFRPLTWRSTHPYVVGDRFEDITPPGRVHDNPNVERDVAVYGWLHGCNMKRGQLVHVAGVGDCTVSDLTVLPDPCPLPSSDKKQRKLDERAKLLYAPMSDVGGLLYDKDAVYISMDDRSVNFSKRGDSGAPGAGSGVAEEGAIAGAGVGVGMVHGLQDTRVALDEKLAASEIQLFRGRGTLKGDYEIPRERRIPRTRMPSTWTRMPSTRTMRFRTTTERKTRAFAGVARLRRRVDERVARRCFPPTALRAADRSMKTPTATTTSAPPTTTTRGSAWARRIGRRVCALVRSNAVRP